MFVGQNLRYLLGDDYHLTVYCRGFLHNHRGTKALSAKRASRKKLLQEKHDDLQLLGGTDERLGHGEQCSVLVRFYFIRCVFPVGCFCLVWFCYGFGGVEAFISWLAFFSVS